MIDFTDRFTRNVYYTVRGVISKNYYYGLDASLLNELTNNDYEIITHYFCEIFSELTDELLQDAIESSMMQWRIVSKDKKSIPKDDIVLKLNTRRWIVKRH